MGLTSVEKRWWWAGRPGDDFTSHIWCSIPHGKGWEATNKWVSICTSQQNFSHTLQSQRGNQNAVTLSNVHWDGNRSWACINSNSGLKTWNCWNLAVLRHKNEVKGRNKQWNLHQNMTDNRRNVQITQFFKNYILINKGIVCDQFPLTFTFGRIFEVIQSVYGTIEWTSNSKGAAFSLNYWVKYLPDNDIQRRTCLPKENFEQKYKFVKT